MTPRWLLAVAGTLVGLSCTPYTFQSTAVKASPLKDSIPGPHVGLHGEALVELGCTSPEECTTFARERCQGDFEIAGKACNTSRQTEIASSAVVILVYCQNPSGSPPANMPFGAPDVGP
jgi:hypothetical protein